MNAEGDQQNKQQQTNKRRRKNICCIAFQYTLITEHSGKNSSTGYPKRSQCGIAYIEISDRVVKRNFIVVFLKQQRIAF